MYRPERTGKSFDNVSFFLRFTEETRDVQRGVRDDRRTGFLLGSTGRFVFRVFGESRTRSRHFASVVAVDPTVVRRGRRNGRLRLIEIERVFAFGVQIPIEQVEVGLLIERRRRG